MRYRMYSAPLAEVLPHSQFTRRTNGVAVAYRTLIWLTWPRQLVRIRRARREAARKVSFAGLLSTYLVLFEDFFRSCRVPVREQWGRRCLQAHAVREYQLTTWKPNYCFGLLSRCSLRQRRRPADRYPR